MDIAEGPPRGPAERTCLIAMRLADHLELDRRTRASLFHAALLKDAGCSSNAAKPTTRSTPRSARSSTVASLHREALPVDTVLAITRRDAGPVLDAGAFAAWEGVRPGWAGPHAVGTTAAPLRVAA